MIRILPVLLAIAIGVQYTCAFSTTRTFYINPIDGKFCTSLYARTNPNAKGCAAVPFEKKKIAVFGAGGYLGAIIFGFLQRASSLYGTGIAGGSSPRAIGATRTTSESLNKVLTPCFKLAYAGEDLVRLIDTSSKDYIAERLTSFDAAILGTLYQLEQRTVTGNTYEKTPNDRTFDFYLDERYGVNEENTPADDSDYHIQLFESAIQACKGSGSIQHVVVLETPKTKHPEKFINILEREGIAYTYIRAKHLKKDKTYSFEKGIKEKLNVKTIPNVNSSLSSTYEPKNGEAAVFREDLAALIVQSLLTLDWKQSRILEVTATSESIISEDWSDKKAKKNIDREWCPNSEVYADLLANLN